MGGGSSSGDNMSNLWNQGSSYQPTGINWPGFGQSLGQGIQQGTAAYARGVPAQLPPASGSDQIRQPFSIQGQANQGYPLIPTNASQSGDQMSQIMQILQQILGSGGQM